MNRRYLYIVCILFWGAIAIINPINASNVPSEEDAKELLKNKCERLGGAGAYERVVTAVAKFLKCMMPQVIAGELLADMSQFQPTGDFVPVVKNVCRMSPNYPDCIKDYSSSLDSCLDDYEKKSIKIVQNIAVSYREFYCSKKGGRLFLFYAKGGPKCVESKLKEIQQCAFTTASKYMPVTEGSGGPPTKLPFLMLDEKMCQMIREFKRCMVSSLKKCSEHTPANLVKSLFNFILKKTPCQNTKADASESSLRGNTTSTMWRTFEMLFAGVILLARFIE